MCMAEWAAGRTECLMSVEGEGFEEEEERRG